MVCDGEMTSSWHYAWIVAHLVEAIKASFSVTAIHRRVTAKRFPKASKMAVGPEKGALKILGHWNPKSPTSSFLYMQPWRYELSFWSGSTKVGMDLGLEDRIYYKR